MRNKTSFKALLASSGALLPLLAAPVYASSFSVQTVPVIERQHVITVGAEEKHVAEAREFVASMARRGIDFLANPDLTMEQRSKEFEELLETSFDMNTIAKFALGRHWRTTTGEQRKEYLNLFKDMLIQVYSRRFSDYDGQDFIVNGARVQSEKDTIVTSYIIPVEGPKIEVEWRVRRNGNDYKIIDVIVEGVSMGVTQRADFASVIQRGGGDVSVLIEHLRDL